VLEQHNFLLVGVHPLPPLPLVHLASLAPVLVLLLIFSSVASQKKYRGTDQDTMPTLVNDLTPPQRSWLFETFGHTGDHDELSQELGVAHYPPISGHGDDLQLEDRRFMESQIDPYQPPRELHGSGAGGGGDRSAIFRRAGPDGTSSGGRSPNMSNANSPRPWSPVGPGGLDDPYFYDSRGYFVRGPPPFPHNNLHVGMPELRPTKRVAHERLPIAMDDMGGKRPVFPHAGEKLSWQQSFDNLVVYKTTFGDCNVPQKFKLNPKLGGWVVRALLLCVTFN